MYVFMHLADKSNSENKKIRVLKLLAIKAACFLKWNLSDFEKRFVCVIILPCAFAAVEVLNAKSFSYN